MKRAIVIDARTGQSYDVYYNGITISGTNGGYFASFFSSEKCIENELIALVPLTGTNIFIKFV